MSWIVVGYATPKYQLDLEEMRASAVNACCPVYTKNIEDKGDWYANTLYKPSFLIETMHLFKGSNLVYVDADARFVRTPDLFNKLDCDIALYKGSVWNGHQEETLSGTIFLRNCDKVIDLLYNWESLCNEQVKQFDQVLLAKALEKFKGKVEILPVEYCAIFDSPKIEGREVVIRHLQRSRQLKHN